MSTITNQTIELLEMLPEDDQRFAFEFVKKLVLAWDPDFTKLTPQEKKHLEEAKTSDYINTTDIDWDNLDKLDL